MVELTTSLLDVRRLEALVADPAAGAVVTFLGQVRNHHQGRAVDHLAYEAFEPMAIACLEQIAAEAKQRWPLREVAIAHRLGRLEIGETAVAICVSSAHRGEAFEACRHIMDRIKQDVPIWKHEHWADGTAEWVGPEGSQDG
ncbi:MAG: molybdenum cofactor biosynthesis protein MoaE [Armatimonadetes bacterium]|nr:molybdenum cofactor biosynthesis protein MoaE [Armatimonadota bacterium]